MKKIIILNCDLDDNPITNGAILLKKICDNINVVSETYNLFDENVPTLNTIKSSAGILITGSNASVYEEKEWIKKALELIQQLKTEKKPTLGICFGFQLICQACGGNVVPSGTYERGFGIIEKTQMGKQNELFNEFNDNFVVYHHHGDIVQKLPTNTNILAKNTFGIQAYSYENFIAVQFHPEITKDIALYMAKRDVKKMQEIIPSNLIPRTTPILIEKFIVECIK